VARSSTYTLHETRTENSAIDPLSQVSGSRRVEYSILLRSGSPDKGEWPRGPGKLSKKTRTDSFLFLFLCCSISSSEQILKSQFPSNCLVGLRTRPRLAAPTSTCQRPALLGERQRQTQTLLKKRSECDIVKASMPPNAKKPTTRVICWTPDPAYFRPS
jgi:hypothetical protein